ncbi:hypothetical protein LOTGIDRAFT_238523 [Lottia gigantea]|uniref:glycerol-3-phosphate dehydrogenase n=1 Tax=Lottia gigantea TaxID=225164 RepID=V4B012_LOTGI|nr:hypothetical protein LOTGIDRAFT_238523 [Lottia gigantea]ESP00771.1 hypothetical protein LOTGIDRAFT_238523 [Lottia gigantea]
MRVKIQTIKRLVYGGLGLGGVYYTAVFLDNRQHILAKEKILSKPLPAYLPPRDELHKALQTEEFDVLVIGGGATGCGVALDAVSRVIGCVATECGVALDAVSRVIGCVATECGVALDAVSRVIGCVATECGVALDAVSRGLKTGLVEKFDYSSGTSSRSTKLIHGGVRYLQKAVFGLDYEQYRMVKEALKERANLIQIAPHLAYPFPIMLPVYKWWQVPYYWAGIKMYDLVAGRENLKSSYYLSKSKALELFPMLKTEKLVGALVYYDGQHDDARMCLALALTAVKMGGKLTNHTECIEILKQDDGTGIPKVCGAKVRDIQTGKVFDIKAKCVINATGPYTDSIRQMGDPDVKYICQPSSGVHIVLPDYYSPESMGLLDPSTSDGRIIFFLPWQKVTIAGTTDNPCAVTDFPQPTEKEIQFILNEVRNYLHPDVEVRRGDVLSAWSGMRPLVADPNKSDTQSIARNHIIEVFKDNLITIAGGKWTTYRHMAEETIDKAVEVCNLQPKSNCQTAGLLLDGAHGWSPTMFIRLVQDFGLENEVAQHLANTYGDKAFKVAKLANLTGQRWPVVGKRLHQEFPYIEAEVRYACREYATSAIDVIGRRTRLAFCNVQAAEESLPRIIEMMSEELGWNKARQQEEMEKVKRFLRREMGLDIKRASESQVPINFSKDEINMYVKRFNSLDSDNKGYITINDLRRYFKKIGEKVTEDQLHEILNEVDLNRNAQVEMGEFLQLMSALKSGVLTNNRLAKASELPDEDRIPVERSGGGV